MMTRACVFENPARTGGKVVDLAEYRLWRALSVPAGAPALPVERFASVEDYERRAARAGRSSPLPRLPRHSLTRRARRAALSEILSTAAVLLATCMATVQLLG